MDNIKFQDFYQLLGVDRSSSEEEIRVVCLKLADRFRPDKNPNDILAARRFEQIERAYELLCDPDKRAEYDKAYADNLIQSMKDVPTSLPATGSSYPPFKKDGIIIIAGAIAAAAIATVASTFLSLPGDWMNRIAYAGLYLFKYERDFPGGTDYLIAIDLSVLLLICFLALIYGVLVLMGVISRPVETWRRIKAWFSRWA
jgi:curved DNA-binding protein CbpA